MGLGFRKKRLDEPCICCHGKIAEEQAAKQDDFHLVATGRMKKYAKSLLPPKGK